MVHGFGIKSLRKLLPFSLVDHRPVRTGTIRRKATASLLACMIGVTPLLHATSAEAPAQPDQTGARRGNRRIDPRLCPPDLQGAGVKTPEYPDSSRQ